ncbi:MAG: orotate phosphoribosyltransferase [Desulfuromonadales bacterium]|nr:orotate phosphoribosyltransferase [Desulfuromonadales bacterium]
MNYRSVTNLNSQLLQWTRRLPRDLELIVGIPRSGLLAANLLALHLNLPLTDLDGFVAGRVMMVGARGPDLGSRYLEQPRKVLVLDDSLLDGTQMVRARKALENQRSFHQLLFAAVYLQPGKESLVDYFCEGLPRPRVFEWHLMHHPNLRHWCVDIDGVLCDDPTEAENDDAENYRRFLQSAEPRVVPSKEIGWLVTCRLEKYRRETEEWLRRHGIRYRQLKMMDLPDMMTRRAVANYAGYKAGIYLESGAQLFIESSLQQAREISRGSGKSVFCFDTREMIHPGALTQAMHQPKTVLKNLFKPFGLRPKRLPS